jgi:nitrogen fixation NifU-like protein
MDHFKKPRNVGEMENADGIGEIGNPLCGDMMTIYLKVENDHIEDIKFQTFGCGAAIAVSSMLTEIAKGKSIEAAKKITNKDVAEALDGLPKNKLHCSNLGADALHAAIKDYEDKKAGKTKPELKRKETHEHDHHEKCYCPYCDSEIKEGETTCKNCTLKTDD